FVPLVCLIPLISCFPTSVIYFNFCCIFINFLETYLYQSQFIMIHYFIELIWTLPCKIQLFLRNKFLYFTTFCTHSVCITWFKVKFKCSAFFRFYNSVTSKPL